MNNNYNLENETVQAASDEWFNQWVEEMVEDFDPVDLDEFILID